MKVYYCWTCGIRVPPERFFCDRCRELPPT
jgi:hypothetical protein